MWKSDTRSFYLGLPDLDELQRLNNITWYQNIYVLVKDCNNSIANALRLLQ